MKIQFKIDRLGLFLEGIDTANSIALLDVDPATMQMHKRKLLHRHLLPDEAGDAFNVVYDPVRAMQNDPIPVGRHAWADLVEAKSSTLDSLLAALEELESQTSLSVQSTVLDSEAVEKLQKETQAEIVALLSEPGVERTCLSRA